MQKYSELLFATGIFINAVLALLTFLKTNSSANTIKKLEQNTNSIKDALVTTTGEAEHAKGMLAGAAAEKKRQDKQE